MRWERLFDDLEAQLDAARREQVRADLADQIRAERSTVHLADRFRAAVGSTLRVRVGDPSVDPDALVVGRLVDATVEWLLLEEPSGGQVVVPTAAVRAVHGLGRQVAPPPGEVERRLRLGHALRALARDRGQVRLCTAAGPLVGRIDVVAADHLDLTASDGSWTVPFADLRAVRSVPV